jgi:hypothetical protein
MEGFLSRGIDYLKELGNKLRDMAGHAALARELIQNAHDAGASVIRFTVRPDGLMVENDVPFRDCGTPEAETCSLRGQLGTACDFHRIRKVAAGEKRMQAGTIGSFGIGFTAVYQLTDSPHLMSSDRHWTLHEERLENERIATAEQCPTCGVAAGFPGTRFWLPWASDPTSPMRRGLSAAATTSTTGRDFSDELRRTAEQALLFLRHPQRIELFANDQAWSLDRSEANDEVSFSSSDGTSSTWNFLGSSLSRMGCGGERRGKLEVQLGQQQVDDGRHLLWRAEAA